MVLHCRARVLMIICTHPPNVLSLLAFFRFHPLLDFLTSQNLHRVFTVHVARTTPHCRPRHHPLEPYKPLCQMPGTDHFHWEYGQCEPGPDKAKLQERVPLADLCWVHLRARQAEVPVARKCPRWREGDVTVVDG